MPVYEKCNVFTCNHTCNLPVIIDSVMGSNLGYLLKSFLCNFLLKRVIWHLVLENGTKFKIPSEIKSPLAWNHQPSYNNDPLHRCCLGTSWRWSSMALWNEVLFTKDPKAISSQQPLLSRILVKYQTFHVTNAENFCIGGPMKWGCLYKRPQSNKLSAASSI